MGKKSKIKEMTCEIRLLQIINAENLVLSGGAVKGIAICGAVEQISNYYDEFFKVFEQVTGKTVRSENGLQNSFFSNLKNVGGTSIGALLGLCVVCNIPIEKMRDYFLNCPLFIGDHFQLSMVHFINHKGLSTTEPLLKTVYDIFEMMNLKYNITFSELHKKTGKGFYCNATCLNDNSCFYMSHLFTPHMEIRQALVMSMCFPLFFNPVEYMNKMYTDGGMVDNCMIDKFKEWFPDQNSLGVYCHLDYNHYFSKNLVKSAIHLYEMMSENSFKTWQKWILCKYKDSDTFLIPVYIDKKLGNTSFIIEKSKFQHLYNCGKQSITQFIE